MPYPIDTTTDHKRIISTGGQAPPFGPGFTAAQLVNAVKLDIIGSSIKDPGEDWTEFSVTSSNGEVTTKRIGGY